jgi:hypothetical protein
MAPKLSKALFTGIAAAAISTVGAGVIQNAHASDLKAQQQIAGDEGGEHSCSGEEGDEKSCSGESSCSGEHSCSGDKEGGTEG